MDIKDLMKEILSAKDAKQGLHVYTIAQRLLVAGDECTQDLGLEEIKKKANQILLAESKKSKGIFAKVLNPKTKHSRKGMYKLHSL